MRRFMMALMLAAAIASPSFAEDKWIDVDEKPVCFVVSEDGKETRYVEPKNKEKGGEEGGFNSRKQGPKDLQR